LVGCPAKLAHPQLPKFVLWENFGVPSLTWNNIWKNRLVKQKLKVEEVAAAAAMVNSLL